MVALVGLVSLVEYVETQVCVCVLEIIALHPNFWDMTIGLLKCYKQTRTNLDSPFFNAQLEGTDRTIPKSHISWVN